MKKRHYRGKLIALAIFLAIFCALEIFLCVWFFGERYPAFDDNFKTELSLPDLSDGFVPQGMCALPGGGYAVSGYYGAGTPSRVYLLGEKAHSFTVTRGGKALETHFGGVAADGTYLYLASDTEILRVPLAATAGESAEVYDAFDTGMGLAFLSVSDGVLYAGEFYRAGNYETEERHRIERDGERNPALVYCYRMDGASAGGVEETPFAVLSVRSLVQGIAVTDGAIYLSCSWGLADSTLVRYENVLKGEPFGTFTYKNDSVPLFFLGEAEKSGSLTAPGMTEGIFMKDGRLFVLFESNCNKYKYFVRRRMGDIVSLSPEAFA